MNGWPAFKVIQGDTMLFVLQNDNRVLRKIKSTGNIDLIFTLPGRGAELGKPALLSTKSGCIASLRDQ